MDKALVSIIVPVYKTPVFLLRRFLSSVLSQTFSDIQLIAINDASPDDCPRILDDVAAGDERVTVLHRSINGRAGMARNDGMSLVTGKYVLFADADDIMQPDMCETLLGIAQKHDADIVACSWSISHHNGHLLGKGYLPDRQYDLTSARQRAKAYRSLNYSLWNKIFRYEIIAPLRFEQFEANIGEDTLFNIAALCRSHKMVTTAYCGYDYTVHTTSATGRSSTGMPYLRTLALSGDRINQTLAAADGSCVAKKYSGIIALKRFSTGCGWIADHPDPKQRAVMWEYWRHHLYEHLLPNLNSCGFLAAWFRLVTSIRNPKTVYCLTHIASRIADPLSLVDRLEARIASK